MRFLPSRAWVAASSFSSLFVLGGLTVVACSSKNNTSGVGVVDAGPAAADGSDTQSETGAPPSEAGPVNEALKGCTADPGPPALTVDANASKDPTGGAAKFTLEQALAGYPTDAKGKLTAAISTEHSFIKCELLEDIAPISVANFVGLARGTRPSVATNGKWKLGRFYDGLTWHRVIPNFVIQGGDPDGDGTGGPGYGLVEENHVDEPLGTLAMAASSAGPSGSQFYVVVGHGPDANYNVFGKCSTESAVEIAGVPRDSDDKPNTAVHMLRIDIARCP